MSSKYLKPLLVVEDNPGLQKQLKWAFEGYKVILAEDRTTAIGQIKTHYPSVVTLDLGLPPDAANASEGLAALQEILTLAPHTKIIVVTGNDDRQNALQAIALGAYDFYQKPIDPEMLALIVERAHTLYELEAENRELAAAHPGPSLEGILGASTQMLQACRMVEKAAPADITTLITGESGTGKELMARALHRGSPRRHQPFIAVNSAAIPENLLESELFGYEKGAFTGAVKQTKGKIEHANGGTLFLDEIGDMPMALQAKLLRFLQERVIERLGGHQTIPLDVRVICATHRDLEASIAAQGFREDLYYRLSGIEINVPSLRDRDGDALLLARSFLERHARDNGRSIKGFTAQALEGIEAHDWPGNVRELENRVKRAVVLADNHSITPEDLGFAGNGVDGESPTLDLRLAREKAERDVINRALALYNHNLSLVADALKISRPTLYNLIKKLAIEVKPGPDD